MKNYNKSVKKLKKDEHNEISDQDHSLVILW